MENDAILCACASTVVITLETQQNVEKKRSWPICVQLCVDTLCKRATLVAHHLANFSLEFCVVFKKDAASLFLQYHGAKSQNDQKLTSRGPSCLKGELHGKMNFTFC